MNKKSLKELLKEYVANNFKEKYGRGKSGNKAKRRWVFHPSENSCKSCKAMGGQVRAVGEKFTDPTGAFSPVDRPPLHKNCKCSLESV